MLKILLNYDHRLQKNDLEKELDKTSDEIDRLLAIKDSMCLHDDDEGRGSIHNLYLRGLNENTTESDLEYYFERFGSITCVKVVKKSFTHRTRGYGFVEFAHSYQAERVLDQNVHFIRGTRVIVQPADHDAILKPKQNRNKPY